MFDFEKRRNMRLKISYFGVNAKPGDVIVVKPNDLITRQTAKEVCEVTKKAFPDNKVVVMLPDYLVKNYNKEEFLKFLDELRDMVEE